MSEPYTGPDPVVPPESPTQPPADPECNNLGAASSNLGSPTTIPNTTMPPDPTPGAADVSSEAKTAWSPARERLDTAERQRVSDALLHHRHPGEVGPYRIIEVIGEGGMGVVYLAEQQRPKRHVALKVIRPGLTTAAMLRRFEYESEVLGRLDSPGIARIYEAGVAETDLGPQPYFAMELVRGRTLDAHVRDQRPSVSQRLALLVEICQAVHHAHTKGVVHRDLKPSNILITEQGRPKILDFGVARAIDSDVQTTTTLATETGQIVGTLPYMAPEQAAGRVKELDTSCDVYALGVVAYELLSGRMPYSLQGKALHEAVRVICEEEPTRLSSISGERSLRGDVETIVRKALEKDKSQRYHTAGELAADVKRYLDYEPITARPPSAWYQLSRFARRNKLLVGAGLALAAVLAVAAAVSTALAVRERRQRETAEAVVRFLTDDVLAGATPERIPDAAVRAAIVKGMVDPAAQNVGAGFVGKPLAEASVRMAIALTYDALGRADLALPQAEAALQLRRSRLGDDHPDTLSTMAIAGAAKASLGDFKGAERDFLEALKLSRASFGVADGRTLTAMNNLASVYFQLGNLDAAEPLFRAALDTYRRTAAADETRFMQTADNLVAVLVAQGKWAEAEQTGRTLVEDLRRTLGPEHPTTLMAISNQSERLMMSGKTDEAQSILLELLPTRRRVLGNDHPDTLLSINNMAFALRSSGDVAAAEPLYREALDGRRRLLPADHPHILISIGNLALTLQALGKLDEAGMLLEELYRRAPAAQMDARRLAKCTWPYALFLASQGRYEEALEPLRLSAQRLRDSGEDGGPTMKQVLGALAEACERTGRAEDARGYRAEVDSMNRTTAAPAAPTGTNAAPATPAGAPATAPR